MILLILFFRLSFCKGNAFLFYKQKMSAIASLMNVKSKAGEDLIILLFQKDF